MLNAFNYFAFLLFIHYSAKDKIICRKVDKKYKMEKTFHNIRESTRALVNSLQLTEMLRVTARTEYNSLRWKNKLNSGVVSITIHLFTTQK